MYLLWSVFSLLLFLTHTVVKAPPSHWIAIGLKVPQNGSTVNLSFQVENGNSRIQAMVLTRSEAERFNRGRSVHSLFASGFRMEATTASWCRTPGSTYCCSIIVWRAGSQPRCRCGSTSAIRPTCGYGRSRATGNERLLP